MQLTLREAWFYCTLSQEGIYYSHNALFVELWLGLVTPKLELGAKYYCFAVGSSQVILALISHYLGLHHCSQVSQSCFSESRILLCHVYKTVSIPCPLIYYKRNIELSRQSRHSQRLGARFSRLLCHLERLHPTQFRPLHRVTIQPKGNS